MKPNFLLTTILGATAAVCFLLAPDASRAQSPDDPALAGALLQLQVQQAAITQNQAKITEQIAVISEELRVARIFVSRGGQK